MMPHLWQSTLFAVVIWLLALALRKNRAAVRYRLWFAASVKFLVPFSLFVNAGSYLGPHTVPVIAQPAFAAAVEEVSRPFMLPSLAHEPSASNLLPTILLAVWFCGVAIGFVFWLRWWRQMRDAQRAATPLPLDLPIAAMASPSRLEPGVFGIFKPVLLLPVGIEQRLTAEQLQSVIAHELCHVRRRDNLTAAIHMVVETIFWFHPLVWFLRTRLVEERERACDEDVLRTADPQVYAEGILSVCKLYLESPLACASGITGADLKKRIAAIVAPRRVCALDWRGKVLLALAGVAAIGGPVAAGLLNAPAWAQQETAKLSFAVASVKLNSSGSPREPSGIYPGGRFTATNNTVRALILNAYGLWSAYRLEGGPSWIDSARYDIDAKAEDGAIPASASNRVLWDKTRRMLRTLLAERFHLVIRTVTREMPLYELAVAKGGPKLQKSDADCDASPFACHGFAGNPARLVGTGVDMYDLALVLSTRLDRPVLDKTGITGIFDTKLGWNPFPAGRPAADGPPPSPAAEKRDGPRPDFASLPNVFDALEQQLGLKLESRKGPVEIYVIDHVEKPSEN